MARRNPISETRYPSLVKFLFRSYAGIVKRRAEAARLRGRAAQFGWEWRVIMSEEPFKNVKSLEDILGVDIDLFLLAMYACRPYVDEYYGGYHPSEQDPDDEFYVSCRGVESRADWQQYTDYVADEFGNEDISLAVARWFKPLYDKSLDYYRNERTFVQRTKEMILESIYMDRGSLMPPQGIKWAVLERNRMPRIASHLDLTPALEDDYTETYEMLEVQAMEFVKFILSESLYYYASDPTRSGKYVLWLAKLRQKNDDFTFPEDIMKVRDSLKLFEKFKHRMPQKQRDINYYKSFPQFYREFVKRFEFQMDAVENEQARSVLDKFYEDDYYVVYRVGKEEYNDKFNEEEFEAKRKALMHLSKPTNWCTKYPNEATKYMNQDDLYIFYLKLAPEGWQLGEDRSDSVMMPRPAYLLHTASGQFMDEEDTDLNFSRIPNVPFLRILKTPYGPAYRVSKSKKDWLDEDQLDLRRAMMRGEIPWEGDRAPFQEYDE